MTGRLTPPQHLGAALILTLTGSCSEMHGRSGAEFGINLAGAEFGALQPEFSTSNPGTHGTDYFFPTEQCLAYFAQRGLKLIRLPVSWERLQAQPSSTLNELYLQRILEFMNLAAQNQCRVVVDLHNYGRYRHTQGQDVREHKVTSTICDTNTLGSRDLADLWIRVSKRIGQHTALHAYGLMNEPHDMGNHDWHTTSKDVVSALRNSGDRNWIWVSGDGWSKAHDWTKHNPSKPWVTDKLNKVAYEAHVYFDADSSGRYHLSFAQEQAQDPTIAQRSVKRLQPFADWCSQNQVTGIIGEYGIPWNDEGWLALLDTFLLEIRRNHMTACAWAAGDMWGDYNLSLQPRGGNDVSPLEVILRHASLTQRDRSGNDLPPPGLKSKSTPR